jgi:hypothetical protein
MVNSESNGHDPEYPKDSKGRFLPGNAGKPKGAMVTSTLKIKKAVVDFLEQNMDAVQDSFDQLKPIEKLQFITSIMGYAIPKQQSVQSEIKGEIDHKIDKITVEIIKATEIK